MEGKPILLKKICWGSRMGCVFALAMGVVVTLAFDGPVLSASPRDEKAESAVGASAGKHLRDFSPIPEEPDEFDHREVKAYYDWRNDLFFREFDMNGSGSVDYMTARRTYKVWLDEFGTPVVVTVGSPLFYWVDRDGNGEFDTGQGEMWSDPNEDGITGEERIYDTSHLEKQPSRIPRWEAPTP